jgi:hypothetical protein
MRSTKRGAASAAPRRKRGGEQTVKATARSIVHDFEVLNWVRRQSRLGLSTKEIVEMSQAGHDYPAAGRPLSDGTLAACRCAIYHLEEQGANWPLKGDSKVLISRDSRQVRKRLHAVTKKRAAARKSGQSIAFWDACYDISKLTGLLISLNIEDADLDEQGLDVLGDLNDDLLFLDDWIGRSLAAVQGRLGEQELRKKIVALRAKTVANGCTVEEEAAARRAADKLEWRLSARLAGVAAQ